MGRGPARPVIFQKIGRHPAEPIELLIFPTGPSFHLCLSARPAHSAQPTTLSIFPSRPGAAHDIRIQAGPYLGRSAISVGRSVDLNGQPMCYPELKS